MPNTDSSLDVGFVQAIHLERLTRLVKHSQEGHEWRHQRGLPFSAKFNLSTPETATRYKIHEDLSRRPQLTVSRQQCSVWQLWFMAGGNVYPPSLQSSGGRTASEQIIISLIVIVPQFSATKSQPRHTRFLSVFLCSSQGQNLWTATCIQFFLLVLALQRTRTLLTSLIAAINDCNSVLQNCFLVLIEWF